MQKYFYTAVFLFFFLQNPVIAQKDYLNESKEEKDQRMEWWREARFGMFIHWGLYSIPAGEWKGETNHAEWIRTTAQIPLSEYDKFINQFNPVKFNAEEWVRMAKDAGMKYITITSKHHDGFCLWDSKETDFDVMSTPFKRDILKELADACRKIGGVKLCFYHSIMDWHHPDYNERRPWEKDRPVEGTDRKRFISYLKNQLKELVTNYGDIGVLWFDGEWENFWTHEDGKDLYNYVRSLKPGIIINNRVDKGRGGMAGMTTEGDYAGDFGTPEQEIPETGLPGVDWESCMTMNDNWGYNKADKNFKSAKDLIQKLVDIASKGGNFLLNIGPKPDGTFPQESIDRLKIIGDWMKINGESIYGTQASSFEHISWGRATQKRIGENSRLYLHVFDHSSNIILNGLENEIISAAFLSNGNKISFTKKDNVITFQIPPGVPAGLYDLDPYSTVIVVDIKGSPVVYKSPVINANADFFVNSLDVEIVLPPNQGDVVIRYTTDGSSPSVKSRVYKEKILLTNNTVVKAKNFVGNKAVSGEVERKFIKVVPVASHKPANVKSGLIASFYEGEWNNIPNFSLLNKKEETVLEMVSPGKWQGKEKYGVVLEGYIKIPESEVYNFYLSSDDGSKLFINGELLIDNDGLHGMVEKKGVIALSAGYHKLRIEFFEKTGGDDLKLFIESPEMKRQEVGKEMLYN